MNISVLCPRLRGYRVGIILPLLIAQEELKSRGLSVEVSSRPRDADVIVLTSEWTRDFSNKKDQTIEWLETLRKRCSRLIFLDMNDTPSVIYSYALPIVDSYWKPYALKDRSAYLQRFYQGRVFADYYRERFGISDVVQYPTYDPPSQTEINKIQVSWSYQFYPFSSAPKWLGPLRDLSLQWFPRLSSSSSFLPIADRPRDVSMRVTMKYPLRSVAFQRELTAKVLAQRGVSCERIPKDEFFRELSLSKIGVSPFGWGEVCTKDFEIILQGCALLKPRIDHVETFPALLVPGETFEEYEWDCSNLLERVDALLTNDRWRTIASNAQAELRSWSDRASVSSRIADRTQQLLPQV